MSFKCFKCVLLSEIIGVGAFATTIVADPEGSAAELAMDAVYKAFSHHYGEKMTIEQFINNTRDLLGTLSDAAFIVMYPKKVCQWFKQC